MSNTTQYPDGIYEFTGTDPRNRTHWRSLIRIQSGWMEIMGDEWTFLIENCEVQHLTPLVPASSPSVDDMLAKLAYRHGVIVLTGEANGGAWWIEWATRVEISEWGRGENYNTPSEAIRAAWEAVCKEEA